jgi:ATP-dependent Clp protease protease subunit
MIWKTTVLIPKTKSQSRALRLSIAELIARECGKPVSVVLEDIARDHWLSADDAIDYGLVSRIVKRREELVA